MNNKLSRRKLLKIAGMGAAGATLAACAPQTVTVIVTQQVEKQVEVTKEVTKEVEKQVEVTKQVEVEKVVEVTSTPTKGVTNALGVEYPADALPLEKQIVVGGMDTTGGGFGHIMESLYNRAWGHAAGFETLTTLNQDGVTVPVACESWTQSDDGLSWDFKMRKDLVWSDGTPMTAGDWEYTLKWSIANGYDFGWFYGDIVGVQEVMAKTAEKDAIGIKAIDDYTLRITTKNVTAYVPSLGTWFMAAKKGIWDNGNENWALDPKRFVASGPFILKEFDRTAKHLWVLNETYKGVRRPYITELHEQPVPTGLAAYISGDIQGYGIDGSTPPAEVAMINSNPVLRAESHPSFAQWTGYIGFNTMKGKYTPIDNPDVRLALCKAIDKENLIGEIFRGFASPAWGILPKGFPGYSGDKLKDLDANKFDVEAAKQLLSKAGFPDGKGFPKFDLWIRQPDQIQTTLMQAVQARWKENLGIQVELKPADFQAFAEVYQGKGEKAAIYFVGYGMDYFDPATFLNVFVTNGGRHPHQDPAWDKKYADANQTRDPAARFAAIAEVEKDLVNSTAYCFMYSPFGISLAPCNQKGPWMAPNKDGYVLPGGYPGVPHAFEGMYWADPACRAGAAG